MHILYLSQYFHPEQFLNNHVAKALAAAGHRVDVICCVPNYPAGSFFPGYSNRRRREEDWEGVRIHRVPTIPRGRSSLQLVANYLAYPLAAGWRLLRFGRPRGDISFVSMPSPLFQALAGIFAKRMWNIPTIYWVQDIWPDSAIITLGIRNRLVVRLLDAICGWIYRQADAVMVQSDGFHAKIAAYGVPASRITTLSNSAPDGFIPIERETVPEHIRALVPKDRRTIMFAGNIGESQDFDTIIAAAAMLPADSNLQIVVVGSGRDELRVRESIASKGIDDRFLFLGRHAEADMPAFFACADVMLVSLRDEPIFALTVPSKVQCYMACGKPILASLGGEGATIVKEAGAGIVVEPGSPIALSAAMLQSVSMSDAELEQMGICALRTYENNFSLSAIIGRLTTKMKQTLSENGKKLQTSSEKKENT